MGVSKHLFDVVYEDSDLLVVNKPAGLVCHPTKTDEYSSLISRARLHLGPGSCPQLINRLDRETSGITLVAKEPEAARVIRRIWENREVRKVYLAIVHGHPVSDQGVVDAPLGKDEQSRVAIKDCVRPDGQASSTEFQVLARFSRAEVRLPGALRTTLPYHGIARRAEDSAALPFALVRVEPRTGRKHQIRIHLASVGHPIVGDKLYGLNEDHYLALVEGRLDESARRELILPHHGLHAYSVAFRWRDSERVYSAAPEPWFKDFLPQGTATEA